ncbi:Ku protein [soil metagenome]
MKAIWTGSIGFGLVNIPIKLYSAVEESSLDLDMLDKKDHANIKFKRVNEHTGKEVAWENIVRGYLLNDKYVILDDDDFKKASPEKSDHIEIVQFINEKEVDSTYFEAPYYLEPQKAGTRAYALLQEALLKSGKAGLGTFVMRSKEHVCLIKANKNILVLNRIRFAEEIRKTDDLNIPTAKSKPAEVKMAMTLINQLTGPFKPEKFKDDYADKLLKVIQAKAKGKATPFKQMKVVHSTTKDLMEQLKASLSGPASAAKKKAS